MRCSCRPLRRTSSDRHDIVTNDFVDILDRPIHNKYHGEGRRSAGCKPVVEDTIMRKPDYFEIHFAERSLEQAKFAFNKFMEVAETAMNSFEGPSEVA